jgi:hypothetical protein
MLTAIAFGFLDIAKRNFFTIGIRYLPYYSS